MKNVASSIILHLAFSVFHALHAVNVPQSSAADYIFTIPMLTNHIRGVVIDVDSTNAYRVIRSEDADWVREALAERNAILAGSVNATSNNVGPIVRRGDIPNGLAFSGNSWLDGGAPLLDGVRLYDDFPQTTNVYAHVTYTNGYTNAVSYITQPMTNGTVSVFTNSWSQARFYPVTNTVTNVHQWVSLDLCHGVDGVPFPAYSNNTRFAQLTGSEPWARFPSLRTIANAREVLRGTVRLADVDFSATNEATRVLLQQYDNLPVTTNSAYGTPEYELSAWDIRGEEYHVPQYTARIPTRFDSSLVTTGGVIRVSIAAVYMKVYYSFAPPVTNGSAMVRLTRAWMDLSGEKLVVCVPIDLKSICSTVAVAAGYPAVPEAGVSYRAPSDTTRHWQLSVASYTIVYRISPSTKLPDW